jgi:hypothetical protein
MKPEIAKQLNDILGTRKRREQSAASQATERQSAEAKNLADFNTAKEKVMLSILLSGKASRQW